MVLKLALIRNASPATTEDAGPFTVNNESMGMIVSMTIPILVW